MSGTDILAGPADNAGGTGDAIRAAVRRLYERHPYPRYPLLARPRWQDGYLTHSGFAASLARDVANAATPALSRTAGERLRVLIGGSGEILPYIVRRWEPARHQVISLDLSRQSLRRARWRLLGSLKPNAFVHADLDRYLEQMPPASFAHADAYGVLHHMNDPGVTLARLGRALAPGGTLRLMVYNADARRFVRHLQRAFALLDLNADAPGDLARARQLLAATARGAAALQEQLRRIGTQTLANDARFADLFLHPRETRLSVTRWWARLAEAGLVPLALFDRYGELDDLPNPLWQPPTAAALAARTADRRFENNLELFLLRPATKSLSTDKAPERVAAAGFTDFARLPSTGPRLWYSFAETNTLSLSWRLRLWRAHRAWVTTRHRLLSSAELALLPEPTMARLARLGALLPGQLRHDLGAWRIGMAPLETSMEAPPAPAAALPAAPEMRALVSAWIHARDLPAARIPAILARLEASRNCDTL